MNRVVLTFEARRDGTYGLVGQAGKIDEGLIKAVSKVLYNGVEIERALRYLHAARNKLVRNRTPAAHLARVDMECAELHLMNVAEAQRLLLRLLLNPEDIRDAAAHE